MGDMTPCKHGQYRGYCDECSPGWELKLIEASAQDMIFERGVQVGKREATEEIEHLIAAQQAEHEKQLAECRKNTLLDAAHGFELLLGNSKAANELRRMAEGEE